MPAPQFIEQRSLSLSHVKEITKEFEERDKELGFFSTRVKEYVQEFVTLSQSQEQKLYKKLQGLELTRLKEEHIAKIIDFLPRDANELKIVLSAYPLSIPKKDQDAIVAALTEFLK